MDASGLAVRALLHEVSIHLCPAPIPALAMAHDPTVINLRLGLGCPLLDRCLGGGLLPRHITEIAGEAGSGKTQLCLQLALQVQLPPERGGLGGGAIYIGTEGNFPQRRLDQLHEAFRRKHNDLFPTRSRAGSAQDPSSLLHNIYIKSVSSIEQLFQSMLKQVPLLVQQRNVRLVIIDSIAALLRHEYGSGAAQIIERSRVLFSQANQLKQIADQLQVVVVVINQVTDYVDDSRLITSDLISTKKRVVPALGLAWSNCINTRLLLTKTRSVYRGVVSASTVSNVSDEGIVFLTLCQADADVSLPATKIEAEAEEEERKPKKRRVSTSSKEVSVGVRKMKVVFSPYLPNNSCSFIIEGDGVRGVE